MRISSLKVTTLAAVIILAGIIGVSSGILIVSHIIQSSGSIRYGPTQIQPLHTEGRYIKDSSGNNIILIGFNKQDFLDFPDGSWNLPGESIGSGQLNFRDSAVRQTLQNLRDYWHVNVLRTHLDIQGWLTNRKTSPYGGTSNIGLRDAVIRMCQIAYEEGMYIVLDFYQTMPLSEPGLPWAESPSQTLIKTPTDFVNFYLNNFIPYFRNSTYSDYPNVIYEPWQEANAQYGGSRDQYFDAITQIIQGMQAIGDNHLVIIQWEWDGEFTYAYEWEKQGRPTQNVVFSMHNYRSEGSFRGTNYGTGSTAYTSYEQIRDYLWRSNGAPLSVTYPNTGTAQSTDRYVFPPTGSNYGEVLTELNGGNGYPIWIGEFAGVGMTTSDNEYNYFVNTMQVFKEWGVGWAFFCYDYDTHYSVEDWSVNEAYLEANRAGQAMIDSITQGAP